MKPNHVRPLIGILTARKSNGSIAGNGPLFLEIQKKLISLDGISFVFTPDGLEEDYINGYTFLPDKNCWMQESFPYPDLVYNRIPFRKAEKDTQCQQIFSTLTEKNIPFFNPCFIDKYELYQLFNNNPDLCIYLPHTLLVREKKDLFSFLKKYKSIYLKPSQSAKGKGIFRLKLVGPSQVEQDMGRSSTTYPSYQQFWDNWSKVLHEKNYLAQEEIKSAKFNGDRFDFRILAHADHKEYKLTGVGIRQSQEQGITTHIPAGGRLLPYELFQTDENDQFINQVIPAIGKALSEQYGLFGEFSIDAGVSDTGQYFIYEVNSKPMSFDEPHIEERKIEQLCRLFLQLTNCQK